MRKLLTVVFLTLGTTWWGAWAQITQGEIVGTPRDASGAAVPGVCVTAAE